HEVCELLGSHDVDPALWFLDPHVHRKSGCARDVRPSISIEARAVNETDARIVAPFPQPIWFSQQFGSLIREAGSATHRGLPRGLPRSCRTGADQVNSDVARRTSSDEL